MRIHLLILGNCSLRTGLSYLYYYEGIIIFIIMIVLEQVV